MRFFFVFALFLLVTGCEKESPGEEKECQQLQNAFIASDVDKVKEAVTKAINSLPSKTHTEQNLNALALLLSNKCRIKAEILCYACIKTLPEESELRISIIAGNNILHKTIDISAFSTTDDKMKFVNMHE